MGGASSRPILASVVETAGCEKCALSLTLLHDLWPTIHLMGVPQVSQGLADRNFGRLDAVILDFSHASGALSPDMASQLGG